MSSQLAQGTLPQAETSGQLYCALSGRPVTAEEAYWAPPLVTLGELLSAVFRTTFSAPQNLGAVLAAEQPDVPYAPEMKAELAKRRSTEQAKLLLVLLVAAAVVLGAILLIGARLR